MIYYETQCKMSNSAIKCTSNRSLDTCMHDYEVNFKHITYFLYFCVKQMSILSTQWVKFSSYHDEI